MLWLKCYVLLWSTSREGKFVSVQVNLYFLIMMDKLLLWELSISTVNAAGKKLSFKSLITKLFLSDQESQNYCWRHDHFIWYHLSTVMEKEGYLCRQHVRTGDSKWQRNSWGLCLKHDKKSDWHSAGHWGSYQIPKVLGFVMAAFRFSSQCCYRLCCMTEEHLIWKTGMMNTAFFISFFLCI